MRWLETAAAASVIYRSTLKPGVMAPPHRDMSKTPINQVVPIA